MSDKIKLDFDSVYLEDYLFFERPYLNNYTHRQINDWEQWSAFINWGRRNPVLFAEELYGVEMMDFQKYAFMGTWGAQFAVWLMSRNAGKSILGGIYIETRTLLIPNHNSYILSSVGSQSIETFMKIENLTYKRIPSFTTLTDFYQGEVIKANSNSNGFIHDPGSHYYKLFNNSAVYTLNGKFDNNRSKRSNLNFYDEVMNSPDELFETSEPFTTQNAEFQMGVGVDNLATLSEPLPLPNQLIYASSAGTKENYLYRKYRDVSLHMDAGDKRYFCLDITADVVLAATRRGEQLAKPLLTQEVIDARLREDKVSGMREYFNDFTTEDLERQIISRADIIRNSVPRKPDLENPDNQRKYIIAYDPARRADNSVIAIGELINDPNVGLKLRIVNVVSLVDIFKKKKTPINTPSQILELKDIILAYNGQGVPDYENIEGLLVDAGSGGAGVPITDFLCEDWIDKNGVTHRGLIDPEYNEGDNRKFPNAVSNVLKLIEPKKYKSELFESFIKMTELNLIEYTEEYMDKGYINLIIQTDSSGVRTQRYTYPSELEAENLQKQGVDISFVPTHLTREEEIALKNIDLMKTEMVNIYRYKQASGQDRFDLAPDKANEMHDDRAYVLALLGWKLAQLRRAPISNRKRQKRHGAEIVNALPFRKGKLQKAIG